MATARLALLGGTPAFQEPLHVGRPDLGDRRRFLARVEDLLDRRWLTNDGPYVRAFERRVAERAGVRECVATASGTTALRLMLQALELEGEVILPAFTFVATGHAVLAAGLRPVLADVLPETGTLDPARVAELLSARTAAILGVQLWGRGCDAGALGALAAERGVPLLFDAAHAFGCTHGGEPIGRNGRAEVFSFHATKAFQACEGGAVVTDDEALAERVRLLRNFGFAGKGEVVASGENGRMSELHAAMGLTTLDAAEEIVRVNREHFARYAEALADLPGTRLLPAPSGERWHHHYVVLRVDAEVAGLHRDELMDVLWAENVLARRYFHPGLHHMEPYASDPQSAPRSLPATDRLCREVLVLPTGTNLSPDDVDTVGALVRAALADPDRVRAALRGRPRDLELSAP